jgi:hypothetical protein
MTWLPPFDRIARFGAALAAVIIFYTFGHSVGLHDYMRNEAEGLHILILLVGGIYSVLLAFAIFVIWTQFTEVENSVTREASTLGDLLHFSTYANPDGASAIRRAMASYVHQAVKYEWRALGEDRRDRQASELFTDVISAVVELKPRDDAERILHGELLAIVRNAGQRREERIAKSLTRMPPTFAGLVNTIAFVLLLLTFLYPFHSALAGAVALTIVAVVLFLANFVMTDTDNPFEGVWNVSSKPFSDLDV